MPSHLKLHRTGDETSTLLPLPDTLAEICHSFEEATGWTLGYVPTHLLSAHREPLWSRPVRPGGTVEPGLLVIDPPASPSAATPTRTDLAEAVHLAETLAETLNDLGEARTALRRREAELAAGVPVVTRAREQDHLAERLEGVLRGGLEAVSCQSAGLYLLDEGATALKLRSAVGLPEKRLAEPARPLATARADLEALAGHAVVLEDDLLADYWNTPETAAAAICVPLATAETVLGTLWLFSGDARPFSDTEANLVEIIAGRLAAELDREMLLASVERHRGLQRSIDDADRLQQDQLPQVAPLIEGWEVAGHAATTDLLRNLFFDWQAQADGRLTMAAGRAAPRGAAGALAAQAVRTAIRAHAEHLIDPAEVLARSSATLWSGAAGDVAAEGVAAALDPATGVVQLATGGEAQRVLLTAGGAEAFTNAGPELGLDADARYERDDVSIGEGDVLLLAVGLEGVSVEQLARCAGPLRELRAGPLAAAVARQLSDTHGQREFALLAIRRR